MSAYITLSDSELVNNKPFEASERDEFINNHLKGIEENNPSAINSLANYYCYSEKNYDLAKKYYLMGVKLNYINSIKKLGDFYESIEKDYEKMKEMYLLGIKLSSTECMLSMAYYYRDIDEIEMEKYYRMAFEHGNNLGISQLGLYYKYQKKDYDKMKECYELGIANSCDECHYSIGCYYEDIMSNYDKMKEHYICAIEKNNPKAMFALGLYYEKVEENPDIAIRYYLMGSELDYKQCNQALANYYKKNKDIENMFKYYIKLFKYKDPEACYEMCRYFLYIKKDIKLAKEMCYLSYYTGYDKEAVSNIIQAIQIKKNEIEGNNIMEDIVIDNLKIDKNDTSDYNEEFKKCSNFEEQMNLFRVRADNGDFEAMGHYGLYHIMNTDDYSIGFKYLFMMLDYKNVDIMYFGFTNEYIADKFKELIKEKNQDAILFLGLYYLENNNEKMAEKYLLQSAKTKNVYAYNYLSYYYSKLDDMDKELKYTKLSALADNSYGYYKLGVRMFGEDKEKGKEYLLKAIGKGNMDALYYLGKYYYLFEKNNAPMMKKCLKMGIKLSQHKESIEYLVNYYNLINYNSIQLKRYMILINGKNTITSLVSRNDNPYIDLNNEDDCNYRVDDNNDIIQLNMNLGTLKKIIYDDENDDYCELVDVI